METLYSKEDAFFMTIGGIDYRINEPIGWNKVELLIERTDKHGLEVNFPSKDITLQFDLVPHPTTGNRSKVLIDDEYALNGPESDITITFGEFENNILVPLATRRIDLTGNNYVKTLYKTACKTEVDNFQSTIEAHYSTPVSLDQTKSLFEEAIVGGAVAKTPVNLHSKAIERTFEAKTAAEKFTGTLDLLPGGIYDDTAGELLWILSEGRDPSFFNVSFNNTTKKGLLDSENKPTAFSEFEPTDVSSYNYQPTEFGKYKSLRVKVFLKVKAVHRNTGNDLRIDLLVAINGDKYNLGTLVQSLPGLGADPITFYVDIDETLDLEAGLTQQIQSMKPSDEIFVYLQFDKLVTDSRIDIYEISTFEDDRASVVELIADTFSAPSVADSALLYDALEFNTRCILNRENAFKSDFYSTGEGKDRVITNGHRIRRNEDTNKAPILNLDDAFDCLEMIDGIGQGFELNSNLEWVLRWERLTYFYQNKQILDLTQCTAEYEETTDAGAYASLISLTYPRLTVREDNGANTIDEFNSEIQILAPLKKITAKKAYKSKWRTSGYDSETVRRLVEKPTESFKSDDDIFLFSVSPVVKLTNQKIIIEKEDNEDQGQIYLYLRTTDYESTYKYFSEIKISNDFDNNSRSNLNGTYRYNATNFERVTRGTPSAAWTKVPCEVLTGGFESTLTQEKEGLTIETVHIVTERDDAFDTLTGIIDPPSVYNARFHPLRCFVNNAYLFNAALIYKKGLVKYRTQFKKENRDLVTKLSATDLKPIGDADYVTMNESDGLLYANADKGRYLALPIIVKFKAELDRADIITIMNAAKYDNDPNRNGYIRTVDNDGNEVDIWIDEVKGLPNQNWYSIIGRKKGNYYDL